MQRFDLLSNPVNLNAAFFLDVIALQAGGFSAIINTVTATEEGFVKDTSVVTFDFSAKGKPISFGEVDLGARLPITEFADTLTLRERRDGNLIAMHDSFIADGDPEQTEWGGVVFSVSGAPKEALFTIDPTELSYQFIDLDLDPSAEGQEPAVLVTRLDGGEIVTDLMAFDNQSDQAGVALVKRLTGFNFQDLYAFDDGSLYFGVGNELTFQFSSGIDKPTADWVLPDQVENQAAIGNRIVTTLVERDSGVRTGTETIAIFERGFDEPVKQITFDIDGLFPRGGFFDVEKLVEIHGTGFAVQRAGTDTATFKDIFFIDIFDLDGDLLKTFKVGSNDDLTSDFRPLALANDSEIELVLFGGEERDIFDMAPIGVHIELKTALRLDGTSEADDIFGLAKGDVLKGFAGRDFIKGNGGDDTIEGGADTDFIQTGTGDDVVDAGDGDDFVENHANPGQSAGSDTIKGGAGDDEITVTSGNVLVRGGDDNDEITAGKGKDRLFGEDGNDTIIGGQGNDTIIGGAGDDILKGGSGNDRITAGEGLDVLTGGAGRDRFIIDNKGFERIDIADFDHREDKIVLSGFADLTSLRKLRIVEEADRTLVFLGKQDEAPGLVLAGVDGVVASDFIF
jgi:Ca2+-binding RTX toxin-like protein